MLREYRMTNPNTSERIILNLIQKEFWIPKKGYSRIHHLIDNSVIFRDISEERFLDLCVKRKYEYRMSYIFGLATILVRA